MTQASSHDSLTESPRERLIELAWLFLKLGTIAFGGPAAHIAMMEDEVVRRRQWLKREEFLDLLGATNLIPGPNSTEMAIHIGHHRAGWPGLLVAGSCFIVPAFLIVNLMAWLYVRYGQFPQAFALLYGVKPVIIAIVVQALWSLGRIALKTKSLALLGLAALLANALGLNELLTLLAGGLCAAMVYNATVKKTERRRSVLWLAALAVLLALSTCLARLSPEASTRAFSVHALFLFFLKIGSVLYGSGYVLLAFLQGSLVDQWHWLTPAQLLDATAVGQVTPGPVFTTATFIGYILAGPIGGLAATVGIFLPAFFFVTASGPLVPRLRRSPMAGAILDGVNASSLALMAVVTLKLGRAAVVDLPTALLAIGGAYLLLRYRVNSFWLVIIGITAGYALY